MDLSILPGRRRSKSVFHGGNLVSGPLGPGGVQWINGDQSAADDILGWVNDALQPLNVLFVCCSIPNSDERWEARLNAVTGSTLPVSDWAYSAVGEEWNRRTNSVGFSWLWLCWWLIGDCGTKELKCLHSCDCGTVAAQGGGDLMFGMLRVYAKKKKNKAKQQQQQKKP